MKIEDFRATTNATTTGDQKTQTTSAPLLDVGRGNEPLKSEIMETISEIIDSGRFIGGPYVAQLEAAVAKVSQTEFGIGCDRH